MAKNKQDVAVANLEDAETVQSPRVLQVGMGNKVAIGGQDEREPVSHGFVMAVVAVVAILSMLVLSVVVVANPMRVNATTPAGTIDLAVPPTGPETPH